MPAAHFSLAEAPSSLDVAGLAARVATTALVCTTCGDEDTGLPLLMSLDSGLSADSDAFEAALGSAGESSTAARREEKGRGRCDGVMFLRWCIGFRVYTSPHNSAALLPIFKRVRSVETPVEFLLERRLARNGRQRDVALQKSRATA